MTMKVVVLNEFRDKSRFSLVHTKGEVLEVDEERGNTLISLHLVEEWKEVPEAPPTEGNDEKTPEDTDAEKVEETNGGVPEPTDKTRKRKKK